MLHNKNNNTYEPELETSMSVSFIFLSGTLKNIDQI